ncbi:MAG: PQQ-binding-like beta-propeller repeat protein [bacterium]|nr:PQQ-binding-like beta-propeller repeat protein [bacterium]
MPSKHFFVSYILSFCTLLSACAGLQPLEYREGDISAAARQANAALAQFLPTEFRPGLSSPANNKLRAAYTVQATAYGYRATLPAATASPTPAVCGDTLIISGGFQSHYVYGVDAESGALRWITWLSDLGPSTPVCADGVAVLNTESCTIFALQVDTGDMLWSHWLGDPQTSSPAIHAGRVFTSYPVAMRRKHPLATHAIAAFNLHSGKLIWQKLIDEDVLSSPVATRDGRLLIATFAGTFYSLSQTDGEILAARHARATSPPILVRGDVYFAARVDAPYQWSMRESMYRANAAGTQYSGEATPAPHLDRSVQADSLAGREAAERDQANGFPAEPGDHRRLAYRHLGVGNVSSLQAFHGSRPLYHRGLELTVRVAGDRVTAARPNAGETPAAWSVTLPGDSAKVGGSLAAPPALAGGYLFVNTYRDGVWQLRPEDGSLVKKFNADALPSRSQAIIDRGRIFVSGGANQLLAYDTGDPRLTGWQNLGGNPARTGENEFPYDLVGSR